MTTSMGVGIYSIDVDSVTTPTRLNFDSAGALERRGSLRSHSQTDGSVNID
jgi:hypothetical protein